MNETLEEWRKIDRFEDYYVSNLGRIKSFKKCLSRPLPEEGRILVPMADKDGYLCVTLMGVKQERKRISQLVAEAFVGPKKDGMHVCHENGIKTDNRVCNLLYKTPRENILDKKRHGTQTCGEKHRSNKLKPDDVIKIYFSVERYYVLMKRYGVSHGSIQAIKKKKSWKHIVDKLELPGIPLNDLCLETMPRGEKHGNSKLKEWQVIEIFTSNEDDLSIANKFLVKRETVNGIRNGRAWAHITKKFTRGKTYD